MNRSRLQRYLLAAAGLQPDCDVFLIEPLRQPLHYDCLAPSVPLGGRIGKGLGISQQFVVLSGYSGFVRQASYPEGRQFKSDPRNQ